MGEKGFVYPLVVIICFMMLIFFSFVTENVFTEREFVYLQEEQMLQVRLLQQAVDRASEWIDDVVYFPSEHILNVNEGLIKIVALKISEEEVVFNIDAVTARQHTRRVKVYYNVKQKSVTKWVEG
ncbi:competence type IV pilus minor pilin ComGG [Fictibacillus sp. UD]|uniref:competence type IV pilus minor pilin ComGG n=1 Tax=Fictibacillus sp. UD TaxID=3038777 RepID=UPI0037474C63